METLTITNQKGGIGKSTTASAIGELFAKRRDVLLIDLDPQRNLTFSYGLRDADIRFTTYDWLVGKCSMDDARLTLAAPNLSIIPGDDRLATLTAGAGREHLLAEKLPTGGPGGRLVVIDTPPSLGVLTLNALTASDYVLIPATADLFSLQALTQLSETILAVRKYSNPRLRIAGVLLTRHNRRSVLARQLAEMIEREAERLGTILFKTTIRETVAVREAQAVGKGLFTYAPRSSAAQDYRAFFAEFVDHLREL